jgi:hypothetical protein
VRGLGSIPISHVALATVYFFRVGLLSCPELYLHPCMRVGYLRLAQRKLCLWFSRIEQDLFITC